MSNLKYQVQIVITERSGLHPPYDFQEQTRTDPVGEYDDYGDALTAMENFVEKIKRELL